LRNPAPAAPGVWMLLSPRDWIRAGREPTAIRR